MDRMTREEIEAVWLDVKRLYEHSVPDVYPAAYERLRKPFDIALQAIDRDAVLEAVDYVLDVWEDGCLPYEQRAYVSGTFGVAMAELAKHRVLKREPSAAPQAGQEPSSTPSQEGHAAGPAVSASDMDRMRLLEELDKVGTIGHGYFPALALRAAAFIREETILEVVESRVYRGPAVSAPDVAEMVKWLKQAERHVAGLGLSAIAETCREAAALLAQLAEQTCIK